MRKNLFPWYAAVGAAMSLTISSCTYDPNYSSIGGSYSSGYGNGYGYGGSNFSTSLFVSTGDPRWGYDPHTYCYYDYRSRRYYDPYLYGYYPVGYRPYSLYGVPHPHGWRPGRTYCPPPRTIRNVTVVNYQNRESAYRNTDYSWARQVRQQSTRQSSRETDYRRDRYSSTRQDYAPSSTTDRSWLNPRTRDGGQTRTREIYDAPQSRTRTREASRTQTQYAPPSVRTDVRTASPERLSRRDYSERSRMQNSTPPPSSRPEFTRPSRRPEPSAPAPQPNFQRPQPSTPPAVIPPPATEEQPTQENRRGRLRSLGEG